MVFFIGFVGIACQLHVVVEPCGLAYAKSSVFTSQWELEEDGNGQHTALLVTPDSIVRHCLMIPYSVDEDNTTFHEVWQRERWADEFHEC